MNGVCPRMSWGESEVPTRVFKCHHLHWICSPPPPSLRRCHRSKLKRLRVHGRLGVSCRSPEGTVLAPSPPAGPRLGGPRPRAGCERAGLLNSFGSSPCHSQ